MITIATIVMNVVTAIAYWHGGHSVANIRIAQVNAMAVAISAHA